MLEGSNDPQQAVGYEDSNNSRWAYGIRIWATKTSELSTWDTDLIPALNLFDLYQISIRVAGETAPASPRGLLRRRKKLDTVCR